MRYLGLILMMLALEVSGAPRYPDNGLYRCRQGNNQSICDQDLRVITVRGKVTELKVMYEGYCNGQGPYTYTCGRNQCSDGAIKITFKDETHYLWENLGHGIFCEMEKIF